MTWRCKFDSDTTIVIDNPQRADAGRREDASSTGAPSPPAPTTSTRARLSAACPGPPDLAQDQMTGVTFQFIGVEHGAFAVWRCDSTAQI